MKFVHTADQGPVAIVTMDRPPVNAVNGEMYHEIRDTFNALRADFPHAKVAVLAGAGKHFCGGNDLGEFEVMTPDDAPQRMQAVREAFWAVHDCQLPVIAAVHGSALGTGLALAASSDMVVCARDARFGLPELSVGVLGGARHLGRLVPQQLVRRMFYTAEPITGDELLAAGGAVQTVDRGDEVLAAAVALAERIARHSGRAIRTGKRALNQIEFLDLKQGYELEQGYTGDMSGFPDAKEAVRAVREKRAPVYSD